MNPYEVNFVTFENLYRRYFIYAENEKEAREKTKRAFSYLSEVLSIKKLEVSK